MSNKLIKEKKYSLKDMAKEVSGYYKQWLKASNLTEESIKQIGKNGIHNFVIESIRNNAGLLTTAMFYQTKENSSAPMSVIGMPFVAPSQNELDEKDFLLNAVTIFTCVANVLDNEMQSEDRLCFKNVVAFAEQNIPK